MHIHKMPSLMFVSQTLLDEFCIQLLISKAFQTQDKGKSSQFRTPNKGNSWSPFTMEKNRTAELLKSRKYHRISSFALFTFLFILYPKRESVHRLR